MFVKVLSLLVFAAFSVAGTVNPACAQTDIVRIDTPLVEGELLDWCKSFGVRCGQPAADAFCRKSGYRGSARFVQWRSPNKPTRIISTGEICDGPECDSFRWIECRK